MSEPEDLADKRRQAIVDYLMSHTLGREFIWELLGECGIYRSSWHPSELIHFNEGRRDVGLKVLEEIMRRSPVNFLEMQRESMERALTQERKADDDGNDND